MCAWVWTVQCTVLCTSASDKKGGQREERAGGAELFSLVSTVVPSSVTLSSLYFKWFRGWNIHWGLKKKTVTSSVIILGMDWRILGVSEWDFLM